MDTSYSEELWGKYRAEVLDINDPEMRGRVKVKCEAVMPDAPELGWAESCFMPGMFFLPRKGDFVWIEFEEGDVTLPVWVGIMPTREYVKKFLFKEYGDRLNYDPNVRMIRSKDHKGIHFMDGADKGETEINVTDQAGSFVQLESKTGDITLKSKRYIHENP